MARPTISTALSAPSSSSHRRAPIAGAPSLVMELSKTNSCFAATTAHATPAKLVRQQTSRNVSPTRDPRDTPLSPAGTVLARLALGRAKVRFDNRFANVTKLVAGAKQPVSEA